MPKYRVIMKIDHEVTVTAGSRIAAKARAHKLLMDHWIKVDAFDTVEVKEIDRVAEREGA